MPNKKILIIGEVYVDTYLNCKQGALVRLGGIFHSARGCDALNITYGIAYYAPSYLKRDIEYYSHLLHSSGLFELGSIDRSPNVMIVQEPKEISNQNYEDILWEQATVIDTYPLSNVLSSFNPTDVLIYPGKYDINPILSALKNSKIKIHIDYHYNSLQLLHLLDYKIESVLISTSSNIFKNICKGSLAELKILFNKDACNMILLKENRGGSCLFSWKSNQLYESPSFYVPTVHSVGVGDCFNSIFLGLEEFSENYEFKLKIAAICSSSYASTYDHKEFIQKIRKMNFQELVSLSGVRLSWEERNRKEIYIAAPDFPCMDTTLIDSLADCLKYHNFHIHLPIRENGLITKDSSFDSKLKTYVKDVDLIERSDLLIAVLLYNDPGTLVELGMFKQSNKPTILFDPYNICDNMFLQYTPDFLCGSIEAVIDSTFELLKRK